MALELQCGGVGNLFAAISWLENGGVMENRWVTSSILLGALLVSSLRGHAESSSAVSLKSLEEGAQKTTAPLERSGSLPLGTGNEVMERVEVTGSHIRRVEVEGVSPVEVIDQKALRKTGYNAVSDVLRDTTANSFGSTRESAGGNAAGVAHVDLRGLGSSNTLVLLNGNRLPTDAVTGAVDLNLIPLAAVERVEVLKDGASAIYGSDALGGVVNIITRSNYVGTELSYQQSVPQLAGGGKKEVSLVSGIKRGKMNMVNILSYRDNEGVQSRDRDWSNKGESLFGSPGSYRDSSGKWVVDPQCPANQIEETPNGRFCRFRYSDFSTELPDLQQMSLLSETNYRLNGRTTIKARVGGTQKKINWSYAPAAGTLAIPGGVASHLGPGGGPLPGLDSGDDLKLRYRLTSLGTRDSEVTTDSYNVLLGTTTLIGDVWSLEVTGSHNRVTQQDKGVNGYALTNSLIEAIETGSFNPFDPQSDGSALNSARYVPVESTLSELTSAEIKASGEIAEWEAGPVGLAVGTTLLGQLYEDRFDERSVNGEVFGNAGSSGGGKRQSEALFTELSLPVTQRLEMQLAGRYDHYSDFGETMNPKAGFIYRPTSSFLWRGSVGTGFKAPLMQDMYAATSSGYPSFIDHVSCQREKDAGGDTPSCEPQQYHVTSEGNPGLKEEKSLSYNTGIVYSPSPDFSIGTDWFLTRLKNVVGISYSDAMLAESQGFNLADYGLIVQRDANGYIDSIEAPLQNLAAQEISGLDLSTQLRLGRVKMSWQYSQLFYFKEEGFPGMGLKNRLGENGRPRWRHVAGISYSPGDRHNLSLAALTVGEHDKVVESEGSLPAYTSLDLTYSFSYPRFGVLTAGVKNLLGTTPPLDDSQPSSPLNVTLYDQIGRQFFTGYKAIF